MIDLEVGNEVIALGIRENEIPSGWLLSAMCLAGEVVCRLLPPCTIGTDIEKLVVSHSSAQGGESGGIPLRPPMMYIWAFGLM